MTTLTTETETKPEKTPYSWTQPICSDCWVQENSVAEPDGAGLVVREPVRVKEEDGDTFMDHLERCCKCVRWTTSRIFVRVDPASVAYPSRVKED